MIRVTAKRLDLHALDDGEELRILTGARSVQIFGTGSAGKVSTWITPTGLGERWPCEEDVRNRWLDLSALAPLRMYWLSAHYTQPGDRASVRIHFRDITPGSGSGKLPESTDTGIASGRLLGVRR